MDMYSYQWLAVSTSTPVGLLGSSASGLWLIKFVPAGDLEIVQLLYSIVCLSVVTRAPDGLRYCEWLTRKPPMACY